MERNGSSASLGIDPSGRLVFDANVNTFVVYKLYRLAPSGQVAVGSSFHL